VKPPRIVELVGVAGSGKTTLAHALSTNSKKIILCDHPYFRNVSDFPFFIWNTLLMAPTFLHIFATSGIKSITPQEMVWMIILNGWHHRLRRQASKDSSIIVLDQGPIALLAELYVLHQNVFQSQAVKKWCERILTVWAHSLDLIIWLDAADTVLIERVRNRNRWHLIKDLSDLEALDLNLGFRTINNYLVSNITSDVHGPIKVEFDTGQFSTNQIVEKTIVALEMNNPIPSLLK
jgi:cytidylate kinase